MKDCEKNLPVEVCETQKHNIFCETLTGRCAATHFMQNGSTYTQNGSTYAQNVSRFKTTDSISSVVQPPDCSNCVCWGENAAHCAKQVVKDAVRCGTSLFKSVIYHGRRRRWWGSVRISTHEIVNECAKWGPCEFADDFSSCMRAIVSTVPDDAKEFVDCVTERCSDAKSCANTLSHAKTVRCPARMITRRQPDLQNSALQQLHTPDKVIDELKSLGVVEKKKLVMDFKGDINDLIDDLRSYFVKKTNWEPGNLCAPEGQGTPELLVTDCGAFEQITKMFDSHPHDMPHLFNKAVDALKACGSQVLPFVRLEPKKHTCFPKIVEILHNKIQSDRVIQSKIEQIQHALMRKFGTDRGLSLMTRRLRSDGPDARSLWQDNPFLPPVLEVALGAEVEVDVSGLLVGFGLSIGLSWDPDGTKFVYGFCRLSFSVDFSLLATGWFPEIPIPTLSVTAGISWEVGVKNCDLPDAPWLFRNLICKARVGFSHLLAPLPVGYFDSRFELPLGRSFLATGIPYPNPLLGIGWGIGYTFPPPKGVDDLLDFTAGAGTDVNMYLTWVYSPDYDIHKETGVDHDRCRPTKVASCPLDESLDQCRETAQNKCKWDCAAYSVQADPIDFKMWYRLYSDRVCVLTNLVSHGDYAVYHTFVKKVETPP